MALKQKTYYHMTDEELVGYMHIRGLVVPPDEKLADLWAEAMKRVMRARGGPVTRADLEALAKREAELGFNPAGLVED